MTAYINFEIGFLREIKNNNYIFTYRYIIDELEKANFKEPHLTGSIELLKRHGIGDIAPKDKQKHSLTPKIQKLHKKRRKKLSSLRDVIDNFDTMDYLDNAYSAKLLQSFLKPIRGYIGSRNISDEAEAVYQIKIRFNCYYYIKLALEQAGLMNSINKLIELNNEILELEEMRNDDILSSTLGKERKAKSYRDLKMVLEVVNSAIEMGREDSETAFQTGKSINRYLRHQRGYMRMVETKKEQKNNTDTEGDAEGDK